MIIQKRDDEQAAFNPSKILTRIKKAAKGLKVSSDEIFIKGITSLPNEGVVTTKEIDKLLAEIAASYTGSHYDYSKLAANIAISSYHKETNPSFTETMKLLAEDSIINDELIKMMVLIMWMRLSITKKIFNLITLLGDLYTRCI